LSNFGPGEPVLSKWVRGTSKDARATTVHYQRLFLPRSPDYNSRHSDKDGGGRPNQALLRLFRLLASRRRRRLSCSDRDRMTHANSNNFNYKRFEKSSSKLGKVSSSQNNADMEETVSGIGISECPVTDDRLKVEHNRLKSNQTRLAEVCST
jgi:hypothetical protein